jgi:uncharacterized RDD family membrane protein YckC
MVIDDFSALNAGNKAHKVAPTEDRLLAFIFDIVLFTPFVSLILAGVVKQIELVQTVSPQSFEFTILVIILVVFSLMLALLSQTVFLFLMQTTPGKYFFKMRVVPYEPALGQTRLTFGQSFLRALLWNIEFCLLGLPWLEVFSDPKRRLLHDRASNTMVVTEKKQIERGPHLLEAQFMRQFFLFSGFALCGLLIFVGGHYYQAVLSGDFRKADLAESDFFCEQVSQTVKPDELRLDKALALFMAGEIEDDCLAAEAEFSLWWPSSSDKAWAYFAKGVLKKSDPQLAEIYWLKACAEDPDSAACELAQYEAKPRSTKIPEGTETAKILKVIQQFELAQYAKAEKSFVELAKDNGFERFAGQGLVKAFWAQDQTEKAHGAFTSVVHQLDQESKAELSAWICHEELDQQCSSKAIEACEVLKEQKQNTIEDSFVALAMIREKECRKTEAVDYRQFHDLFRERADVLQFVKAIAQESKMSRQQRLTILEDLSFRKDSVRPAFLRLMSIQEWLKQSGANSDFSKVTKFLKEKKVRDLSWVKVYKKSMAVLLKNKAGKDLVEIASLPNADLVQRYELKKLQIEARLVIAASRRLDQNRLPATAVDNQDSE